MNRQQPQVGLLNVPYSERKHILTESGATGDDPWIGLNFIDPLALIVYPFRIAGLFLVAILIVTGFSLGLDADSNSYIHHVRATVDKLHDHGTSLSQEHATTLGNVNTKIGTMHDKVLAMETGQTSAQSKLDTIMAHLQNDPQGAIQGFGLLANCIDKIAAATVLPVVRLTPSDFEDPRIIIGLGLDGNFKAIQRSGQIPQSVDTCFAEFHRVLTAAGHIATLDHTSTNAQNSGGAGRRLQSPSPTPVQTAAVIKTAFDNAFTELYGLFPPNSFAKRHITDLKTVVYSSTGATLQTLDGVSSTSKGLGLDYTTLGGALKMVVAQAAAVHATAVQKYFYLTISFNKALPTTMTGLTPTPPDTSGAQTTYHSKLLTASQCQTLMSSTGHLPYFTSSPQDGFAIDTNQPTPATKYKPDTVYGQLAVDSVNHDNYVYMLTTDDKAKHSQTVVVGEGSGSTDDAYYTLSRQPFPESTNDLCYLTTLISGSAYRLQLKFSVVKSTNKISVTSEAFGTGTEQTVDIDNGPLTITSAQDIPTASSKHITENNFAVFQPTHTGYLESVAATGTLSTIYANLLALPTCAANYVCSSNNDNLKALCTTSGAFVSDGLTLFENTGNPKARADRDNALCAIHCGAPPSPKTYYWVKGNVGNNPNYCVCYDNTYEASYAGVEAKIATVPYTTASKTKDYSDWYTYNTVPDNFEWQSMTGRAVTC